MNLPHLTASAPRLVPWAACLHAARAPEQFTQMGVGNVAAQFLGSGASMVRLAQFALPTHCYGSLPSCPIASEPLCANVVWSTACLCRPRRRLVCQLPARPCRIPTSHPRGSACFSVLVRAWQIIWSRVMRLDQDDDLGLQYGQMREIEERISGRPRQGTCPALSSCLMFPALCKPACFKSAWVADTKTLKA